MTARRSFKRWRLLGMAALALLLARCAPVESRTEDELPAMLILVSPGAPLGLNYGESALLELGYMLRGKPKAGVTLHLSTDGDDGGATLSTASVVTNDRGQASARLTAGAAESAFHVLVTVPQAAELVIDVAVSRYDFGRMLVKLDTRELTPPAVTIEAGAYIEKGCAELPPTAKLMGALRSMQAAAQPGELFFAKLLLHDYTVVGRALDRRGRLIAHGCVGLPERLLKSGVVVPLAIPLQPVFISPVGSFTVRSELQLHLPEPLFATLACRYGLAQTLLDELLVALAATDRTLAMRLQAARSMVDGQGCRSPGLSSDAPDQSLQTLLGGTAAAPTLIAVAVDMAAVQDAAVLTSRLDIRGSEATRWFGDHTLLAVTLKSSALSATYPLLTLPTPTVRELPLSVHANLLGVPTHALSLQLPEQWRQALAELVLLPKGVTMSPSQLWQAVVSGARSGMATGCQAVEAVLCSKLAPPCKGVLVGPCQTASTNIAAALLHALDDAPPQLDLRYGLSADLDDPDDLLQAKALSGGQAAGELALGSGTAAFTAIATGTRRPD